MASSEVTCKAFIPSYNRAGEVTTLAMVPDATLVVRASQEAEYSDCYPDAKIWACPDEEIDSLAKVRQYIIDNAGVDIVIELDDDIRGLRYLNKQNGVDIPVDMIYTELERVAQILYDLSLGFASLAMNADVRKYSAEFAFKGTTGGICWFNPKCMRSRYDNETYSKEDTDLMLQELLRNRIAIVPAYIGLVSSYDKNSGGNNDAKTEEKIRHTVEYMKQKWGRHYDHNFKTNQSVIKVKR